MEQNDVNGAPSDRDRKSGGPGFGRVGMKGSNKIVIAIWMALLLGGISWYSYRIAKGERLLKEAYALFDRGDFAGSTEYLRQAAGLGNAWAQAYYGERLKNGFYAEQNMTEALKWLRKAASKKCPEAFFQLGICYENGEGVERNLDEAETWYRKALDAGFGPSAQYALDRIANLKRFEAGGGS